MKFKFTVTLILLSTSIISQAAYIGPAVPSRLTQESNILHVHFPASAAKYGLPECATRVYIDISTDAGKMRASMALSAFMAKKKLRLMVLDGKTSCQWSSSVKNDSYIYIED